MHEQVDEKRNFYYFYYIIRAHDQSGQNIVHVALNMIKYELSVFYFTKFHPYGD